MLPLRLAAFSMDGKGGNPAGVVIAATHPPVPEMAYIAAELGYSETAFACPDRDGWRVRYFSPESEVPFCGHATIALGSALAEQEGDGVFNLYLNDTSITVEGYRHSSDMCLGAALQSPETHSSLAAGDLVRDGLALFGLRESDLDLRLAPRFAHAGANHLILALKNRAALAEMSYDLDAGRAMMQAHDLITIALVWSQTDHLFHVRNAFASGGVIEDPATGAAAAAFAGVLRDVSWPHGGKITLIQGEDMGARSQIVAEISAQPGASIRVSGEVHHL